jgi:hypothetical protein
MCLVRAASADTTAGAITDGHGIGSGASADGGSNGHHRSGHAPVCTYRVAQLPTVLPPSIDMTDFKPGVDGVWYEKWCDGIYYGLVWISRTDPRELADTALRYLPLPLPRAHLSPAGDQVVNVPTWLWLDGAWTTLASNAAVPGVAVNVRAVPERVVWHMGDGGEVVCNGPGVAYDARMAETDQASPCTYTYRRSSVSEPAESYRASVTVTWNATWSVVGAAGGGDLGPINRTASFTVRVGEVQALNTEAR